MSPYLLLVILWVLYGSLHSIFARQGVKNWFAGRIPWFMPHYRLFYSIGATLGFVAILFYNAVISGERILTEDGIFRYLGLIGSTAGVIVIRQAFRVYSFQEFVGLKPVVQHTADQGGLKTNGILSRVRHPLYLGTLLLLLGFWLYIPTLANLITVTVLVSYLFVGIRLEEQDLQKQFGAAYTDYKSKVPMLIPAFGRKANK